MSIGLGGPALVGWLAFVSTTTVAWLVLALRHYRQLRPRILTVSATLAPGPVVVAGIVDRDGEPARTEPVLAPADPRTRVRFSLRTADGTHLRIDGGLAVDVREASRGLCEGERIFARGHLIRHGESDAPYRDAALWSLVPPPDGPLLFSGLPAIRPRPSERARAFLQLQRCVLGACLTLPALLCAPLLSFLGMGIFGALAILALALVAIQHA